MEKRLLLAAALSLGILILWESFAPKPLKRTVAVPTPVAAALASTPTPLPETVAPAKPASAPEAASAESEETLSNAVFKARFSNRGAVLKSVVLTSHLDDQQRPLELVPALPPELPHPLGLDFGKDVELTRRIGGALFVAERGESDRVLRFRYADASISVTKEIRIGSGYLFDVKVSVAGPPYSLLVGPGLRNPSDRERASRYVMPATAVAATTEGIKLARPEKASGQEWAIPARGFAGLEDSYFLEAIIPKTATVARVFSFSVPRPDGKPVVEIATGVSGQGTLDASAFFGPKDVSILESYGVGLERTVDFGWYGILARPLLWMLKKAYAFAGNYGLAILVVTFVIRLLLFPLTAKSYASMKKMQKLAPKMTAIRDKYKKSKTDAAQRQKMNAELMALYQSEGYNPMSGCLPIVLQLPILVAFYNVLSRSIELRHAPFVFWIKDLSAIDSSYILVILMIVSMYVQQAMTPSTMDPAQKKIFMFMPVVWGFFLKDMPSGLVLYWLFSNLLTIVQQLVMNRIVKDDSAPPPKVSAKALKQARA